MKAVLLALAVAAPACVRGSFLNRHRLSQEPDTSCGKGFEDLVDGSKQYFATLQEKLWLHPGQTGNDGTFEQELQCWFANMLTSKCGGMASQYDTRNKALTEKCSGVGANWLDVWNTMFSADEKTYWRKYYPAEELVEGEPMHYKQAMKTALDLNKRELMCMTLFTIDDDCGEHTYIRMFNEGIEA
eukprot:TRINITY_DN2091_c0_g2_i1.p2 TRINITY_DN2091_c0_g2~~TRINITY_DN2091_c0_g2_i1.p2  ORF type:complete len:186 (-),score=67.72 TRINITY_DN2091_c0_g2_i1:135-692(-)